jgi:DNA-binding transcriptional LysR family regulator
MIDDLRAIAIFAEMAKQGSFRGAAQVLGLSPSVVGYHVSQLEKHVGTALVYRSTRKLSLTHEGEILYQHARDMLTSAREGLSKVSTDNNEPGGKLTVTLPSALTRAPVNYEIAEFCKLHRGIDVHISYTDVRQDLIANGIDIALRIGDMEDSSLKSKRIGQVERKLVCSPDYWAQQAEPKHPQDLASWHWIKLAMMPSSRSLINIDKQSEQITFNSHLTVDNVEAMTQFCILGLGLATPPDFLVEEPLDSETLVEVLQEWQVAPIPLYAVWHANASDNSNTRRLLNFLNDSDTA